MQGKKRVKSVRKANLDLIESVRSIEINTNSNNEFIHEPNEVEKLNSNRASKNSPLLKPKKSNRNLFHELSSELDTSNQFLKDSSNKNINTNPKNIYNYQTSTNEQNDKRNRNPLKISDRYNTNRANDNNNNELMKSREQESSIYGTNESKKNYNNNNNNNLLQLKTYQSIKLDNSEVQEEVNRNKLNPKFNKFLLTDAKNNSSSTDRSGFDMGEYISKMNASNLQNTNTNNESRYIKEKEKTIERKVDDYKKMLFNNQNQKQLNNEGDFKVNLEINRKRGSLKDKIIALKNYYYDENFFLEKLHVLLTFGYEMKKVKNIPSFKKDSYFFNKVNIRLNYISDNTNLTSKIIIDEILEENINYKKIGECELLIHKYKKYKKNQKNQNQNINNNKKNKNETNNNDNNDIDKYVYNTIKIKDIASIIFGNFTSNFSLYKKIMDEKQLENNANDDSQIYNEINSWKCFSIINKDNQTFDFVADDEDHVFTTYLIMNILILNYKNKTIGNEKEQINDFQLNDNLTPKKTNRRNKSFVNLNPMHSMQLDKGDFNDTKRKLNFGGGDISNLDISNDDNFRSVEKTRKKFDIKSTKNMRDNADGDYKSHNRSKSTVFFSELTKTRNDVNLRNLKDFNVKSDFIEKVEKNKFDFLKDEDKKNRIDYRIFKKLIIIFLWNRTYLKLKGNFNNVKNESYEENSY